MAGQRKPTIERFLDKFEEGAPDECWRWQAGTNGVGYGMIWSPEAGRKVLAHRLSFEYYHGRKLSDAEHVLHYCDNPSCVNPYHLSAGTRSDNMRDAANKFRSGNQIVTDDMAREILRTYIIGTPRREIAAMFGISPHTVSDYTRRKSKAWVDLGASRGQLEAAKQRKPSAKITREDVAEIRRLLSEGMTGREIARRKGIHFATVSDIKTGKTWKDA